jgi:hypothetical protein
MVCHCEGEGFTCDGHVVDISYGGAGIAKTETLPAQGAELLVKIVVPGKTVELRSRVAWVKSAANMTALADFGVEFMGSLSERKDKLSDFLPE